MPTAKVISVDNEWNFPLKHVRDLRSDGSFRIGGKDIYPSMYPTIFKIIPDPSPLQELARQRNSAKWRLAGLTMPTYGLTEEEKRYLNDAFDRIKTVLAGWDQGSRQLGLNPKEKKNGE